MLYIFHVDTGTMMIFEMNLALESVGQLKEVIEKTCKIPVEKQVLLVSGGECLDPCAKVCSYSAGTDTNPIFLFSKCTLENAKPPSPSIDYGSDSDMKELVDNSLVMPATYNTVVKRTQIAQQFCELAREHTLVCEGLVHDQHLQQQGWAAAVANLEDITADFRTKSEMFEQSYRQYLENREENLKMLQNFSSDLQVLAKIPILDPLMSKALSFTTPEERKKFEETEGKGKSDKGDGDANEKAEAETEEEMDKSELRAMTLLKWISTADNQSSLEQVAEQAQRGLEQFDEKVLEALIKEVEATIETADKCEMKEIKGLEERLFGLEQLMVETKKIVQEQTDLAQALQQNQTRASSLNDPSILPDLCASHRKQLLVMLHNQHMLRDIRRRCSKAKEELSINLYHRLGWVMYVENLIVDVSNKLMIYHENLKRLRKYLEITRQVQRTPQVYVAAVSEVVRRRTFSQAFLTWASDLSCRLLAVYNEEYEKRKDFQSQFEGHFLQSLFPGLEDNPSTFATQAPAPFDASLPQLTTKDIEQLQVHLPDMPMSLSATQLSSIAQLFLTGSMSDREPSNAKENVPVEDKLVVAVTEVGLGSKLDKTFLQPTEPEIDKKKTLQLEKDFESETDTEEFEKVCQSPVEGKTSNGLKFEEDSNIAKNEVETLKLHLSEAGKLANETAIYLKTELVEMKSQSLTDKEKILDLVKDIQVRVSQLTQRYSEEVEAFHRKVKEVMESRDCEIQSLKQDLDGKERVLEEAKDELAITRSELEKVEKLKEELEVNARGLEQLCDELKSKQEEVLLEKEKAVQFATDNYNAKLDDYKELLNKYNVLQEESAKLIEEREALIHDHKTKMDELNSALVRSELDSEMEREKTVNELNEKHAEELGEKLEKLKRTLKEESNIELEKAVKEVTERLTADHKAEIESLRSRFRLVSAANMEKSPSDSSLEKIEKLDVIELINHEAIIAEIKETAEREKAKAVQEAVNSEVEKLKSKLFEEFSEERKRCEEEKQMWLEEAVNKALADKNDQIQMLLIKQENLVTECQRHRNTIKLLTDGEQIRSGGSPGAGTVDPLLAKIEALEKEKMMLTNELDRRKLKPLSESRHVGDMTASFAVIPVPRDAGTSPESSVHSERKSSKSSAHMGKISINSCSVGDAVLVLWNLEHSNYTILQESSTLYFVHSDCLDSLGLKPGSDGSPRRLYSTAEVVDKEYCHARKAENRFKVPKGTKFYRVKVRPMAHQRDSLTRSGHHQTQQQQQHHLSLSDSMSSSRCLDTSLTRSCGIGSLEDSCASGSEMSKKPEESPTTGKKRDKNKDSHVS